MGLTLSPVRGWDTTHLIDAADHWDRVATEWEASFDAVHRESLAPGGTEWDERAADAAHERTALDRVRALATVDGLRAQAGAAPCRGRGSMVRPTAGAGSGGRRA
jgi:hypothetical protein